MEKLRENARIVFHEQVSGQIFLLRLESPRISAAARAGQFVMLRVRQGNDPLLRRPFSFYRIYPEQGEFEVLYRLAGQGTLLLSRMGAGSTLDLIGPLGNGFQLPIDASIPLALIAGGIGIAPLSELIYQIAQLPGIVNARLFYGARTASELLPEQMVRDFGIPVHFATDDGTFGYNGRVTRLFDEFTSEPRNNFEPAEVCSCGPLAMQYHVAKWVIAHDTLSQLSLESLMACGIGACLGCALPASGPDTEQQGFVHVCEHGPIFSAGSIKWNQIMVQQTPPPTWLFS